MSDVPFCLLVGNNYIDESAGQPGDPHQQQIKPGRPRFSRSQPFALNQVDHQEEGELLPADPNRSVAPGKQAGVSWQEEQDPSDQVVPCLPIFERFVEAGKDNVPFV